MRDEMAEQMAVEEAIAKQRSFLLNLPEDEALDFLQILHGFGEVEAFHMLEVIRGNIGPSYPSEEERRERGLPTED